MKTTTTIALLAGSALLVFQLSTSVQAQPGGGARGGGPGGRAAGHRAPGVGANMNPSPSISRPGGGGPGIQRPGGSGPGGGVTRPNAAGTGAIQRPNVGQPASIQRPNAGGTGGIQRPNVEQPGAIQRPNAGGTGALERPSMGQPGAIQRPNAGGSGSFQRPNVGQPGAIQRPNAGGAGAIQRPDAGGAGGFQRPGAGDPSRPSSASLQDFLGAGGSSPTPIDRVPQGVQRPGAGQPGGTKRPGAAATGRVPNQLPAAVPGGRINAGNGTNIGTGARANVGVGGNTTNVNVGNVNVGSQVSYSNNRQAWVSQRQNWGNDVRTGIGGRYNNVFNDAFYRGGYVKGGYNYYGGWIGRGPYYAWSPVTWAAIGAFFGGSWATAQPVYYAYGQGGNVYYENNLVYVNGQAAGTPAQYYQQAQSLATAAPPADQVNGQQQDWLPLGVFALTSEDTGDSQAVVQLAVNKQGVIAGTYYNEAGQVSRPIQGTVDVKTQRAAISFADNKNSDLVLETSINNLTQDEAPALLHFGAEQSQPVLLVRLKQPEGAAPSQ